MQALVLVGGEGTRLRPLTLTQPKPAVPLVDRPFIRFMVDWLGRHGVSEVIMACGFRAEDLRASLGDEVPGGPAIRYVEEPEPLGTAGPIRLAAEEGLLGERFLVLNGDVLTDLDLSALIASHTERRATGSLALYPVADPSSYGLVRTHPDGAVKEFLEKPDPAEIDTDLISAGAYVLERSVIDLIPAGRAVSIEREVFPRLVGAGLYGLRLEGYWMDIGTPTRYLQASWDILEGRVTTQVGARVNEAGLGIDEHAEVDGAATVDAPALVESGATVAEGAVVGPRAVLMRDVEVGPSARVSGSVLLPGCTIGEGASVSDSILAAGVEVGAGAVIAPGSVIGENARIEPGTVLEAEARVEPGGVYT
jgi:mannose-1-phosphate guanylyltransferase